MKILINKEFFPLGLPNFLQDKEFKDFKPSLNYGLSRTTSVEFVLIGEQEFRDVNQCIHHMDKMSM